MKYLNLLFVCIFSNFLFWVIIPLKGLDYGGFRTSSLVGFVAFFLLTIVCFRQFKLTLKPWQIILALITGLWLFDLPIRILHFEQTLISLPDSLFHTMGIIFGVLFHRTNRASRVTIIIIGCLLSLFLFFAGWGYWLHRLNYGTFTGKIDSTAVPVTSLGIDVKGRSVTDRDLEGKVVLLDFWYTGCGVCFKKFPQLQTAYDRLKNDPSIAIFAVDIPVEEDKPNQAFEMIKNLGYSFPVITAKDDDLSAKFGVKYYPTTFVINRDKQIVYKGDVAGAVQTVCDLK